MPGVKIRPLIMTETQEAEAQQSTLRDRLASVLVTMQQAGQYLLDEHTIEENQKSDAQKRDEEFYKTHIKNKINKWVGKYDAKLTQLDNNVERLIYFAELVDKGEAKLKSGDIKALQNWLGEEQNAHEEVGVLSHIALSARRAITGFAAGFIIKPHDIEAIRKLSKEQQAKIALIQECLAQEASGKEVAPEFYVDMNTRFQNETAKQRDRESRSVSRIIGSQLYEGKLLSSDTAAQLSRAALHPFNKVVNNPELSMSSKATKIIAKALVNPTKAVVTQVIQKGSETSQFLVRHTIKQPVMSVARFTQAVGTGAEYLKLVINALDEKDPEKKLQLQQQADKEFKNLGYQGEKFVRATLATAGISLLDVAIIGSAGITLPTIMTGLPGPAVTGISATAQALDHVQTGRDGVELMQELWNKVQTEELKHAEDKIETIDHELKHSASDEEFKALSEEKQKHVEQTKSIKQVVRSEVRTPEETSIQRKFREASKHRRRASVMPSNDPSTQGQSITAQPEVAEEEVTATLIKSKSRASVANIMGSRNKVMPVENSHAIVCTSPKFNKSKIAPDLLH